MRLHMRFLENSSVTPVAGLAHIPPHEGDGYYTHTVTAPDGRA